MRTHEVLTKKILKHFTGNGKSINADFFGHTCDIFFWKSETFEPEGSYYMLIFFLAIVVFSILSRNYEKCPPRDKWFHISKQTKNLVAQKSGKKVDFLSQKIISTSKA